MTDPGTAGQDTNELDPSTGDAPPFRPLLPRHDVPALPPIRLPCVGERIDDFELLRELGVGSFGQVFLARQLSLDRLIALKVSANRGHEGQTLARLEHSHIVQVFSEVIDSQRGLRLLCMQYVPGTTLERVMGTLSNRELQQRDGRAILEVLDSMETGPVALDLAGLREREFLAGCDGVEAACWLGARLAEALAHAHGLAVLHCDIKPANVLLNRYGRPFLADFNVSADTCGEGGEQAPLGGTLAYMSPEHLEAFASVETSTTVDERADLYSLGMLLYELFTGRLPPIETPRTTDVAAIARALAGQRRAGPPCLPDDATLTGPVACVLRRCLQPVREQRYPSAAELAQTLDGCRELRRVEKSLPPAGPITRALRRWPFALGCLLVLLPHFLGSIVNISYNSLQIADRLTPSQQTTFQHLVLTNNAIIYPEGILMLLALIVPVRGVRLRLAGSKPPSVEVVRAARRRALRFPAWCVVLSCLGWLPGGILFPWLLDCMTPGVTRAVYGHFLISFTISGLIALTYSFFAIEYVVLRVLYPLLWIDARGASTAAREELRGTEDWLAWFQFLAVLIPLAGAALMVGIGAEGFDSARYRTFRLLVTALIGLGMIGLAIAMVVRRRLTETLAALTSGAPR